MDGKKKEIAAKADDPSKVWDHCRPWWLAVRRSTTANCAVCHQALTVQGRRSDQGLWTARRWFWIGRQAGKQIAVLLNGQNNGTMPAWKQLSDTEIAAVITYTKNNWSNKTGQLVQPAEVVAARKQ